ncbi:MAG: hypothetical protein QOJ80_4266 [Mycobacterium sp.]|jgi:hypothetical protein|nr:hypothetical protein [Mycobacterium sp.]
MSTDESENPIALAHFKARYRYLADSGRVDLMPSRSFT